MALASEVGVRLGTQDGARMDTFSVPSDEGSFIPLPRTISIAFPSSVRGTLLVYVDAMSGFDVLASGEGQADIAVGAVTLVTVPLAPASAGGDMAVSSDFDLAAPVDLDLAAPVDVGGDLAPPDAAARD